MAALISSQKRRAFWKQNNLRMFCRYCGRKVTRDAKPTDPHRATIDHIKPKALGGTNRLSNLVVSCFECNQRLGKLTATKETA